MMTTQLISMASFLAIFLIIFLLAFYFQKSQRGGKRYSYDERQIAARGNAYKAGFYTLLFGFLFNGLFEVFTKTQWGSPITETLTILCLGIFVYSSICIFNDAYFDRFDKPLRNILVFSIVGMINLWSGIRNILHGESFDSSHRFHNLNLVCGILLIAVTLMLIIRCLMEKNQNEE